jgi:hypothetical protein
MGEVVGVNWSSDDEVAILAKAKGLGWEEPKREIKIERTAVSSAPALMANAGIGEKFD